MNLRRFALAIAGQPEEMRLGGRGYEQSKPAAYNAPKPKCEMEAEMPGAPPESGPAPADTIGEARSQADAFSSRRMAGEARYAAARAAVSPLVTDSLPAQHDDQAD
jgi:hypothetical protein